MKVCLDPQAFAPTLARAVRETGDGAGGAITRGRGEAKGILSAESRKPSATHRALSITKSQAHAFVLSAPSKMGGLSPSPTDLSQGGPVSGRELS